MTRVLIEACVDSVHTAVACVEAGARRLELCGPGDGGTTPSRGLMREVRARCAVPIVAMIRPRSGDFVMDPFELAVMAHDIACARAEGMNGIALGVLQPDGVLDLPAMARCIDRAGAMTVTMHRAFDQLRDPLAAIDVLADLGVARILTSGGAPTAREGAGSLAAYVARAGGRLTILPGGSIRAASVAAVLAVAPVAEVHARGTTPAEIRALAAALDAREAAD